MKYWSIVVLLALGCGNRAMVPSDGGSSCDAATYPCGPYGTTVGYPIDNLTLSGNGKLTDNSVHPRPLADYRNNAKLKLLLILVAAEWCVPCKNEQKDLVPLYQDYQKAGGKVEFLEIIAQDAKGNVATIMDVDKWASQFSIPFEMAADPDKALAPYYNLSVFPMQMLVRTSDMQIVWQHNGIADDLKAQIDAALAQ